MLDFPGGRVAFHPRLFNTNVEKLIVDMGRITHSNPGDMDLLQAHLGGTCLLLGLLLSGHHPVLLPAFHLLQVLLQQVLIQVGHRLIVIVKDPLRARRLVCIQVDLQR